MNEEYDFRFAGLRPIDAQDKDNALRVKAVRNAILKIAPGFTELNPGIGADMIPGGGMGYIVALSSKAQALKLEATLRRLAKGWGLSAPFLRQAAAGSRKDFTFFLIPELANPAEPGGYRRPLFRQSRWAQIQSALNNVGAFHVELVYGEWLATRPARPTHDASRMYIVHNASTEFRHNLEGFIRAQVFDGGIECDQICIYLSCGGVSHLIFE